MNPGPVSCRCGKRLGRLNASGVLHADGALHFIDLDLRIVTLRCPSCGNEFTVRPRRIAVEPGAT